MTLDLVRLTSGGRQFTLREEQIRNLSWSLAGKQLLDGRLERGDIFRAYAYGLVEKAAATVYGASKIYRSFPPRSSL